MLAFIGAEKFVIAYVGKEVVQFDFLLDLVGGLRGQWGGFSARIFHWDIIDWCVLALAS